MAKILDSGGRREFSSGAVGDIQEGKGRCDLLPLSVICPMMETQEHADILYHIAEYMNTGYDTELYHSMYLFAKSRGWSIPTMIMEVSKQYEDGAEKYGEHNWEKGIPLHCYIDSAVRHFLKFIDGRVDEPHDRAFIWNILGALWTESNLPDMVDLTFPGKRVDYSDAGCDDTNISEVQTTEEKVVLEDDTVLVSKTKLAELLDDISTTITS